MMGVDESGIHNTEVVSQSVEVADEVGHVPSEAELLKADYDAAFEKVRAGRAWLQDLFSSVPESERASSLRLLIAVKLGQACEQAAQAYQCSVETRQLIAGKSKTGAKKSAARMVELARELRL